MTPSGHPPRVAYVMSRFPKLSETFVLEEIRAVEQAGVHCELFPLIREQGTVPVSGSDDYVRRAHYQPALSLRITMSALAWLFERPVRVVSTVALALRGVIGSRKFTIGLVGLLPKTMHNARVARTMGIDHVHAHFAHHPALAAWIIHRLTGIPYSFTAHGHDVQVDRRMLCRKVEDSAFAVTISEHNRALMVDTCPGQADRIDVLHTGVDTRRLTPDLTQCPTEGPWSPGRVRILSVGRLEPVKGHAVLVDAARRAVGRGIDLDVVIVGEGPQHDALEQRIAARDLRGRVRLFGPKPHDEVLALMRSADVVVLPSAPTSDGRVEGIPVVLMEAMSLGTPVAASRLPGVVELLGPDHPLLFPPGDANGLADAIARLAEDATFAAELAASGRARVLRSFDIHLTAESLAERFRSSCSVTQAGPSA